MTINFEEQNESIKTKNVLKKCSSVNIKSACPNGYQEEDAIRGKEQDHWYLFKEMISTVT